MTAAKDDRIRILKMLEEGKITAEEAAKLLDAVAPEYSEDQGGAASRMLRIRVWENEDQKVNVNIPIGLAKWAARFIPEHARAKMGEQDIDVDGLVNLIETSSEGKIVDIQDGRDRVEVTIE
jgi:hypothetical protein